MIFEIKAVSGKGANRIAVKFERMGVAAIDAKPVMNLVAERMMEIIRLTFDSQGRRGGGSWRKLTTEWLTRKQRLGLDPRIGHATLALRDSLTVHKAPGQVLLVTDNSVHLSSSLPYAATQQRNRPFWKPTHTDRAMLRQTVREYLIMAWRAQ